MISLLSKPYPYYFTLKRVSILAFSISIFIGVTFYIFSNKASSENVLLPVTQRSFYFALITFFSIILVFELVPRFYISNTKKEEWTVFKQLGLISLLLFTITIFNFTFILLISKDVNFLFSLNLFLTLTLSVFLLGILPSIVVVWVDYTIKLKENLKKSHFHNEILKNTLEKNKSTELNEVISIPSETKNEVMNIDLDNFLFIKAEGNYIEVYSNEDEEINKDVYRASIQTIEKELENIPYIIRTHRSYIVNIHNIKHSQGTARNYQLFFSNINDSIPVARNRFQSFNKAILN